MSRSSFGRLSNGQLPSAGGMDGSRDGLEYGLAVGVTVAMTGVQSFSGIVERVDDGLEVAEVAVWVVPAACERGADLKMLRCV